MPTRLVLGILTLCGVAWSQGGLVGKVTGKSKPPARKVEPAAAADEGTYQKYLEMRAFAEGLYNQVQGTGSDQRGSDLKRRVDSAFEEARKGDMQRAYEMNLSAKSETQQVIEDHFRVYSGLYDNPILQMLTNRVGQSIIPQQTTRHYTFKLVADPVPWAESLSTGSVWVSTGLVAMLDSKAQLCYILAHEAAHVYLSHHRQRIMLQFAEAEYKRQYDADRPEPTEKSGGIVPGWLTPVLASTPGVGSLLGQQNGALMSGLNMLAAGGNPLSFDSLRSVALSQIPLPGLAQRLISTTGFGTGTGAIGGTGNPRSVSHTEWNRYEEDEADQLAFDWLLRANIDVRQIPTVYQVLRDAGDRDPRITLGFLGRSDHVRERLKAIQERLEVERKQPGWDGRPWQSVDREFQLLLADIKRDNGIFAFHHDMIETARENLKSAVATKPQDSSALYFYAKLLAQTARTDAERKEADDYFQQASVNDIRNENYGSHLYRGLLLLTNPDAKPADKKQAAEFLARYLLGYHFAAVVAEKANNGSYPPHLETVYDYMARAGEFKWELDEEAITKAAEARKRNVMLVDFHPFEEVSPQRPARPVAEPEPKPQPKPAPPRIMPKKQ